MSDTHWMKELLACRQAGNSHFFILWGNIYDRQKNKSGKYFDLCEYIAETFAAGKVMFYSLSGGLRFAYSDTENWFKETYLKTSGHAPAGATDKAAAQMQEAMMTAPIGELFDKDPSKALPFFERVLADNSEVPADKKKEKKILVIECAHNLAPAGAGTTTQMADRVNAETLERWARDARFKAADSMVILLTPQLAALAPCVRSLEIGARPIRVPKPDMETRLTRWQDWLDKKEVDVSAGLNAATLARISSGLSLRQIDSAHAEARVAFTPLNLDFLRKTKQAMLEAEFGGRVRVKMPEFGLEYLGGKKELKIYFKELRHNMLSGNARRVPMGILASGSPGTGKTFAFECFAHDCGLPVLELVNPRSMWVGESEALMEQFLSMAYDLRPCLVIEDEADQSETSRDAPNGDTGVSNRLRQMKFQFCSDPRNRGQVVWVRITNRDDLLDAAYKRKGRTDDNICFLLPDAEESEDIFRVMFTRYQIPRTIELSEFSSYAKKVVDKVYCSGGDIEWMVLEADKIAGRAGKDSVEPEHLKQAIDDWETDVNPDDIDYQTIQAIKGSAKRLRPADWQKRLTDANARITERQSPRARTISTPAPPFSGAN